MPHNGVHIHSFFFFPTPHKTCGIFLNQGSYACHLNWKHGVLTTGLPGKSPSHYLLAKASHSLPKWLCQGFTLQIPSPIFLLHTFPPTLASWLFLNTPGHICCCLCPEIRAWWIFSPLLSAHRVKEDFLDHLLKNNNVFPTLSHFPSLLYFSPYIKSIVNIIYLFIIIFFSLLPSSL